MEAFSCTVRKVRNHYHRFNLYPISLDDLVPQDHILRLIEQSIDFDFIYDEGKEFYPAYEVGRPAIDPVSLFKIVFIQYLFGIRSMRQTIKEIDVNVAYRWFIGYGPTEKIPHFSTFGKNYTRRFKDTDIFERIFEHILHEAVKTGFVDASAVFIDGTYIKANANKNKKEKITVTKPLKQYHKELRQQVTLTFACMNLKKLAIWKKRSGRLRSAGRFFTDMFFDLLSEKLFFEFKIA